MNTSHLLKHDAKNDQPKINETDSIDFRMNTYPGILCPAPFVDVPAAILPCESKATMPIVSWLPGPPNLPGLSLVGEEEGL